MIVELHKVEVDHDADLLLNLVIATIFVVRGMEVGSLRCMGKDGIRGDRSVRLGEVNQPLLTLTMFHSFVVLPISISTI